MAHYFVCTQVLSYTRYGLIFCHIKAAYHYSQVYNIFCLTLVLVPVMVPVMVRGSKLYNQHPSIHHSMQHHSEEDQNPMVLAAPKD